METLGRAKPTAEQLDREFNYPPGAITFERLAEPPVPDDPFRVLATVEDDGRLNWRVTLRLAS